MKKLLPTIVISLCCQMLVFGQCFTDRHNLTMADAWVSCETAMSPNLNRGESHWIMYDLGTTYELGASTFWNINNYMRQDDGAQEVIVDLSTNGSTWSEAAQFTLAKGPVSSFYEGVAGPDLTGSTARFVLITALSNYGGACTGLSEFRVQATPATTTEVSRMELGASLVVTPNPFDNFTTVQIELSTDGDYRYQLTSLDGKVVRQGGVSVAGGLAQVPIRGADMQAGMYLFTIMNDQARSTISIVKN